MTDARRPAPAPLLGALALLVALLLAYHGALRWIQRGWFENPYYSHGPLVPLITLYLLWRAREQLLTLEWRTCWPGLLVLIPALGLAAAGYALDINVAVAFSLLLVIHAIVLTTAGPRVYRAALFPLLFLTFAVPIPQLVIYDFSFPLQLSSARLAPLLMRLLTGADAFAKGEVMWLDRQEYIVGVQCSGFKALIGLLLVGLLVAYLTDTDRWRKLAIALSAAPLAVVANVIRLFLILCVGRLWGRDFAVGRFHDFSGYLMLFIAIGLLLGAARLVVGPAADLAGQPPPEGDGQRRLAVAWQPLAVLAVLLAVGGVLAGSRAPRASTAPEVDLASIPREIAGRTGEDLPDDPRVQAELGDVALLNRRYSAPGEEALQLIVICGRGRRSLHTPQACYRGAGNEILGKTDLGLGIDGDTLNCRQLTVGDGGRPIVLALYTFTDGQTTTPEWRRQQRESFRDNDVVWTQLHLAAPWQGSTAATRELLDPFLSAAWPSIKKAIPYSAP